MASSVSSSFLNVTPKPNSASIKDPNSNPRRKHSTNNIISQNNYNQNNHNNITQSDHPDDDSENDNNESDSTPPIRKLRASVQLKRWSRARAIRSGRRFNRAVQLTTDTATTTDDISSQFDQNSLSSSSSVVEKSDSEDEMMMMMEGKSIYMVSDGTGWTAEHSVGAALGQFEHCLVDRNCAVNTHLFSGVNFFIFFSQFL